MGEHALVRAGTVIPPDSIVVGSPAKVIRTQDNSAMTRRNATIYHENALAYAKGEHRAWAEPGYVASVMARLAGHVSPSDSP